MYLDKIHNSLSWVQVSQDYSIGASTAMGYVDHILNAILTSFSNSKIISFPTPAQRKRMVQVNVKRGVKMPYVLFTLDGKHARCTGRHRRERRSFKFHWLPAFNALFIIERVFGSVVAFNLDGAATKHDSRILRESEFFRHINELLCGWVVLGDKAYGGIDSDNIAAGMKKNDKRKAAYSKDFWHCFHGARGDSERAFAHFFFNKYTQLNHWTGKGDGSFVDWAKNVTCCIALYNFVKLSNAHFL